MQALRDTITANLAAFERRAIDEPERRHAAVAILISPREAGGEVTYAITRRALTLRRGAGNFALPGGNREPGEDAIATAIRETSEELGVAIPREDALGMLDDFITLGGHVVTPVVLWSSTPLELNPDPAEVHVAMLEPLSDLDRPDAPMREDHPDGGEQIVRMFVGGHWINPPTAAFLYPVQGSAALHGRADPEVHAVGQPNWTRK